MANESEGFDSVKRRLSLNSMTTPSEQKVQQRQSFESTIR